MAGGHKPRSGSLGFWPRKRADNIVPRFDAFALSSLQAENVKGLNFLGYKAGMVHGLGRDSHAKSTTFGQEITVPITVVECPPLKVFGVRAYGKKTPYGQKVLGEVTIEKADKFLRKALGNFKVHKSKKKKNRKPYATFENLEKMKENVAELRLLVHAQPQLTDFGKKKPEVVEVRLSGNADKQFAYAKEKFGKELKVSEVFKEKQFVDIKAVDKGKGFTSRIKRFHTKTQRPKSQKPTVGSLGPWHPAVLHWQVPMPGQMGFQTRTELNKRVLKISEDFEDVTPVSGFQRYGNVKNEYVLIAGSVSGPPKRAIAMRDALRIIPLGSFDVSGLQISSRIPTMKQAKEMKKKPAELAALAVEETPKAEKMSAAKQKEAAAAAGAAKQR